MSGDWTVIPLEETPEEYRDLLAALRAFVAEREGAGGWEDKLRVQTGRSADGIRLVQVVYGAAQTGGRT